VFGRRTFSFLSLVLLGTCVASALARFVFIAHDVFVSARDRAAFAVSTLAT